MKKEREQKATDEQVVRALMTCETYRAAAAAVGMTPQAVYVRAQRLVRKGVKLPDRRKGICDVAGLNAIIAGYSKPDGGR